MCTREEEWLCKYALCHCLSLNKLCPVKCNKKISFDFNPDQWEAFLTRTCEIIHVKYVKLITSHYRLGEHSIYWWVLPFSAEARGWSWKPTCSHCGGRALFLPFLLWKRRARNRSEKAPKAVTATSFLVPLTWGRKEKKHESQYKCLCIQRKHLKRSL